MNPKPPKNLAKSGRFASSSCHPNGRRHSAAEHSLQAPEKSAGYKSNNPGSALLKMPEDDVTKFPAEAAQCAFHFEVLLGALERRANEGQDLDSIRLVARCLVNSGLFALVDQVGNSKGCLAVKGRTLRERAERLDAAVREWYANPKKRPEFKEPVLEAINRKLDLLAGAVAGLVGGVTPAAVTERSQRTENVVAFPDASEPYQGDTAATAAQAAVRP